MGLKYNSIEQHVTPRPRSKRLREVSGGAVVTGQGTSSVEGGLGDGHTHANLKDLDKISFDDEKYLYVTQRENDELVKDKAKCGTADNLSAESTDWGKILLKATFADMFEKVNLGTTSNPIYAIRAKYSLYSDGGISAYGASNGQGGGGTAYDRLDKWADYGADKAGYVLSALLGNDLNERLKTVESGSVLDFGIDGTGNAVTGVNTTGNKVVLTKGVMFALSSHTHSWSEIGSKPTTLAGYGITDAKIANGVILLGSSSITPLTSHQSLAGYATESWVSNNFNKYVLPIASASVAGGVMIGNGLNISSGILSVGYGSVAGTACQGNDARLSNSRPASDVYTWAKQSAKPGYSWSEIGSKPTTLAGYGITDANIANGVISLGSSSITPLTSHQSLSGYATESWVNSKIADMFEKVNIGTASNPAYVIRAKYSLYSDGGISAYGASNGQGGGGTAYDRLDKWADYGADKTGYVLSALLGNDLNERLKTVESGSVLEFSIDGTGNAVTGVNTTGNKVVLTKGVMFALSSHTHSWSEIGSKPSTLAGYGITDAKIANGVILLGSSSITPLTSHQSLAGYATENWVSSNFNKYVLPIASATVAGGVMIGNGLNISSGVLSVGYGSAAGTACQGNDARLSDSRPASDVYSWAKQSAKPGYSWNEIGLKPTTLAGYGITDANIANGVISIGGSSIVPLTSHQSLAGYATENWVNSIIADMFEKVNLGTTSNPIYVIRAKYSLYSDGGISAYGATNGQGGGGNSYDRLDKWADYGTDKAGYVLSALLGNDLNERMKTVESGSVLDFSIEGTGNAVTGINKTDNKVVLTKGVMFALSSHTHSWSEIGARPTTLTGYGITDAKIASGVITLGSSSIAPLTSHQSLAGYATENWVNSNFNKYVLPIASGAVAGGVMVGNGLNINSGVLSVGYGNVAGTACQGNDARLSDSRPASDVYAWAKQSAKPGYSWNEIGLKPSTLAGYGITDAKIANGVISLGSSSIAPLTSHQSLAGYATENWVSSNFNKYVLPIASATVAGGVMVGNGLNISSGVLSVGYGSVAGTACQGNDARLSNSRPASDVYTWAKQSAKPGYSWSEIGSKPTTLAGYGITDAKIANGVISLGSSSITPLTSHQSLSGYATESWVNSKIADMFEKVNVGTASNPVFAIRAKYSLYSDGGISAYGASNGQGGGGTAYDRLDKWADYGADKTGYVLSALLGNDLNERLKTVESGSVLEFSIDGTGNAVTGVNKTGNKVVLTKGVMFALSSHTHSWSEIGARPTTLTGYGITDAKIASGVITLGSSSIAPLTSHQSLAGYATENWVNSNFNKYVLPIASGAVTGGVMVGNGLNINSGVLSVGYGSVAGTACQGNDARLSNSRPASDVYTWAKQSAKPGYSWSEIGSKPTTLAGYGITDAKIANGVISLGSSSITPLTSHQSLAGYATESWVSNNFNKYVLPIASASVAGGVMVGNGLNISSGILSVGYGSVAGTACQGNDARLSNSRPASDVYTWAKQSAKPGYSWSEIGSKPTTLAGYGITDAKIANGVISLGGSSIVPLTSHQSLAGYATESWVSNNFNKYVLPTASSAVAGGVMIGNGLNISSGILSVGYGSAAGTACQGNDARLSNSRPASDVYTWAKQSAKPGYSWSEIGSKPTTIAGYGITDAVSASTLAGYLPLTGGTIRGVVQIDKDLDVGGTIYSPNFYCESSFILSGDSMHEHGKFSDMYVELSGENNNGTNYLVFKYKGTSYKITIS